MVKKLIPAVLFIMTFCFWSAGSAFAEAVVVEGDKIFIADGGLRVLEIGEDGKLTDPGCFAATDLTGATDVVIADGHAIVTFVDGDDDGVVIVDVSACLSDDVDVEECIATVDLDEGILEIPCVYVDGEDGKDGKIYTIRMDQRGNSMNWEVSFVAENGELLNYRRNGDDEDGS